MCVGVISTAQGIFSDLLILFMAIQPRTLFGRTRRNAADAYGNGTTKKHKEHKQSSRPFATDVL